MHDDIRLAFSHPEDRASASATRPLDRISLRDLVLEADIGAFQPERGKRQRLQFNVVVEVQPPSGPREDDVDRILSYDKISEAITDELATRRLNLLETLADEIAARILAAPQAHRVFLRIEKLDRGPAALGVEIVRSRDTAPATPDLPEAPMRRPLVMTLAQARIDAPDLAKQLTQIANAGRPVVLVVGPPPQERPRAGHPAAQRRIDLLAMEQNAWVLAARDPRCSVVASHTEIDWAMRQGHMVVWAPSKLVLDTPNSPRDALDATTLGKWLAGVIGGDWQDGQQASHPLSQ